MSERIRLWKPYLALLAVYIIWGTTTGAIRIGVESIPSALLPCARFLLAGTLLVTVCLLKGERMPTWRDFKTHAMIGFLLFFMGNSIVCWTVKYVTTGFGGILVATTPLWMTLLSAVMPPREKVPLLSLAGILIGFVGMLILLSPHLTHLGNTTPLFWLCLAGLALMTFCWAFGSIYARKFPTHDSLLMSVGVQNLVAGVLLVPVCAFTAGNWGSWHPSGLSLSALAYLVLMGTMTATPCYLYVIQTLPVSVSSTFAYVTPVLTILFGWLFLGEPVTRTMILGATVILTGVLLVQIMNWNAKARQSKPRTSFQPVSQGATLQ